MSLQRKISYGVGSGLIGALLSFFLHAYLTNKKIRAEHINNVIEICNPKLLDIIFDLIYHEFS